MVKFYFKGNVISPLQDVKKRCGQVKVYFQQKSGGKTILSLKKIAPVSILIIAGASLLLFWLGPKEDHTYYRQASSAKAPQTQDQQLKPSVSGALATLFGSGEKRKEADKKKEADEKRRKVAIRYFAPQVLGVNSKGRKVIKSGSKLIGVLLTPIDTRSQSLVRVKIPQGGESLGVEIERESILVGQFSYSGSDERVYLTFSRVDLLDGDSRPIRAQALDAGTYTAGVSGDHFSGNGVKLASNLGLTMFAGMTDTLTDRQSLGNSFNGVQAKPSMKNGLLQGLSRASQDQASRTASAIDQDKGYVLVPEGKEMIIELSEDFKNE